MARIGEGTVKETPIEITKNVIKKEGKASVKGKKKDKTDKNLSINDTVFVDMESSTPTLAE